MRFYGDAEHFLEIFGEILPGVESDHVGNFAGYDESRKVKNILFENLQINGTVIYDDMPGKPAWYKTGDMCGFLIGEHVDDVKFVADYLHNLSISFQ